MHELAVTSIRTGTQANAQGAGKDVAATSFKDLLAALQPPGNAERTVVHQGDCLSRICAERLKELGRPASRQEIHAAVQQVAKANQLADPNRIYAGQALDLSSLATLPADAASARPGPCPDLVAGTSALSSPFGLRKDPFTGRLRQHNGIDVAARPGTAIQAFEAGNVTFSGWKPGYGNTVILHHEDGSDSLYGHVAKALVKVGEQVAAHSPIAQVGSNGRSTGPHLHFEIRKNGVAMDPFTQLALQHQ
jgi:murein DD-endopeptidase MepM/ murein hydrolase activator NlpD